MRADLLGPLHCCSRSVYLARWAAVGFWAAVCVGPLGCFLRWPAGLLWAAVCCGPLGCCGGDCCAISQRPQGELQRRPDAGRRVFQPTKYAAVIVLGHA